MPSNEKTEVTPVLFRKDREGIVFALFPTELGTIDWWTCSCYEHVGGHSSADLRGCIRESRKATPKEYRELARELEQRGYILNIVRRASGVMDQIRKDKINAAQRP